jgi:multiple sugar transport system substrate-binding protein
MRQQEGAKKKFTGLLALTAISAVALAGCTSGTDSEESAGTQSPTAEAVAIVLEYTGPAIELSYWNGFTGGDGPFMQSMVEEFNASHDNITIVNNTLPWGDMYSTLPTAVGAGEGPDVGAMHMDQLPTFAARGLIVPLDDLVVTLGLTSDDFTPEVWDATLYDAARVGIPLDVHSLAMYYNTEHFEKAGITAVPTNGAEFEAALIALQAAGYQNPFWMPNRWPSHLMTLSLTWQFGGSAWGADGSSADFASEAGVKALEWQRSIIDKGFSPNDVAVDSQYIAFKNGENSITWDGIWQINDLQGSEMPFGVAAIPMIGTEPGVWANAHNFFMTTQAAKDANKAQASKVFIAWMSEKSGDWAGSGMIPARDSVRTSGVLDGLPQGPVADQISAMRFLPAVPGIGGVQGATFEVAVSNGILGLEDIATALKAAQDQANALLEENRVQFGG